MPISFSTCTIRTVRVAPSVSRSCGISGSAAAAETAARTLATVHRVSLTVRNDRSAAGGRVGRAAPAQVREDAVREGKALGPRPGTGLLVARREQRSPHLFREPRRQPVAAKLGH